jgi:hypothetical protein
MYKVNEVNKTRFLLIKLTRLWLDPNENEYQRLFPLHGPIGNL